MLGLFGSLDLNSRALGVQQQAIEVTGQNLANVNNPAYARQRLQVQTSLTLSSALGPQGTGVDAVGIQQVRDSVLDGQIQHETSLGAYWQAQQTGLQYADASLGETVSTQASGTAGSATGLTNGLSELFNAFQGVATTPTSMDERKSLITAAQSLSAQFNQTDQRLSALHNSLNQNVTDGVASANQLLDTITGLNQQIAKAEAGGANANDVRDLRQQKLEDLAKLVNVDTSTDGDGTLHLSINGQLLVSGGQALDHLQTYDAGGGQLLVRTSGAGTPLNLSGGSVQGNIEVRDGALATIRQNINQLASQLITQVNAAHSNGYNLQNGTGAAFFTGTTAGDIQVNAALAGDPSLIQASGVSGAPGDKTVAKALAALASQRQAGLNQQTFSDSYGQTVAGLGAALSQANAQAGDQQTVQQMLQNQRESVSGVSLDEEMANMLKYQKAFQASARMVSTIDSMLTEVINMKR